MSFDYESLVPESWHGRLGWERLSADERSMLGQFSLYMFRLGQERTGQIVNVEYGGRLVILDDGSRWEVDSLDEYTAESWGVLTKVLIIDDKMYNLDDAEHILVEEDLV